MLEKCLFAFAFLAVLGVTNASAQAVWQADVKIQSLAVTAARTQLKTPRPVIQPRVGVFAYSDSPDPNTDNNHAETVVQ